MPLHPGPHFIGIGAQKAGTSWLYQQLAALPHYHLPPKKELHYFDRDARYPSSNFLQAPGLLGRFREKGRLRRATQDLLQATQRGSAADRRFYQRWHFGSYTDAWYRSLFADGEGYTGEISPSYALLSSEDIRRMYAAVPQAKLVFLVRNPLDRAWSNARFHTGNGLQADNPHIDTDGILQYLTSGAALQRSDYLATLRRFAAVYPPSQLLVAFYEAIVEQPWSLLQQITDFVGPVSPAELREYCAVATVHNPSVSVACPPEITTRLQVEYQAMLAEQARTLGGYAQRWLHAREGKAEEGPLPPATLRWEALAW